jgi:hypothetical protein
LTLVATWRILVGEMLTNALTLTDRFAWLFDGLCKMIGVEAQRRGMEAALAWAVWNRVRVLGERLIALAERVRAGRVPATRTRHRTPLLDRLPPGQARGQASVQGAGEETEKRDKSAAAASERTACLPHEFGWVVRALPRTMQFAGVLNFMLREAEVTALVEQAPQQAGRILRPLCHLLGVTLPAVLLRAPAGDGIAPAAAAVVAEAPDAPIVEERRAIAEAPPAAEVAPAARDSPAARVPRGPPGPGATKEELEAYYRRPGGLYWDGTGLRWS